MRNPLQLLTIIVTLSILFGLVPGAYAGPVKDAAVSGETGDLEALLQNGAEPDEKGVATPLYFASQRGRTEAVALLLEYGADPNALSKWGAPLHIAARQGHVEIVKLLLERGADPNLPGGEDHHAPLHQAATKGRTEVIELLIERGADVNARARYQEPPIHFAVLEEQNEAVALLLERGAEPMAVKPISLELAAADLEVGRQRALACTPCHTLEPDTTGERGPSLWGIVGRAKASVPDFPYSKAMRAQSGFWGYEELNQFIADVPGTVPGTGMYFGAEPDRKTRIALIAYLRTLSDNPEPLP